MVGINRRKQRQIRVTTPREAATVSARRLRERTRRRRAKARR